MRMVLCCIVLQKIAHGFPGEACTGEGGGEAGGAVAGCEGGYPEDARENKTDPKP